MVVKVVVEVADDVDLLLNDFGKDPVFDCKQSGDLVAPLLDPSVDAHPQRHPRHDFKHNAAETPDVDGPRVLVLFHFLQHFLVIVKLVLEENVVEDLGRHVLGCRHRKLLQVGEEETAAEVDELNPTNVVGSGPHFFFSSSFEQDVLGFEVGVHYVVAVHQKQSLHDLCYYGLQFCLVLSDVPDQIFVLNLV